MYKSFAVKESSLPPEPWRTFSRTAACRLVWLKFAVAARCTVLLPGGKRCIKPQLEWFPLTSEQFSIPPPCYVRRWFSTDRALDVNIRPDHGQLALRRLCQPLWLLWEMLRRPVLVWVKQKLPFLCQQLSNTPTNTCIISSYLPRLHQSSGQPLRQSFGLYTCTSHHPSHLQLVWSTPFQSR